MNKSTPTQTVRDLKVALPLKIRYIRDWLNGSTVNTGDHWVEIQAFSSGVNVARGKPVSTSPNFSTNGGYLSSNVVTNGDTNSANWFGTDPEDGKPVYVQVDLQQEYELENVRIWHYYDDRRTYHRVKTDISTDGNAWYTIFDSEISGEYAETSGGKNHIISLLDNISPDYYDNTPDTMVQNPSIKFEKARIMLDWESPTSEDITGIVIRKCEGRQPIDAEDGDLVFETEDLSITSVKDRSFEPMKEYFYTIYTYDSEGNFYQGSPLNIVARLDSEGDALGRYFMHDKEKNILYYDELDNTWVDITEDFTIDHIDVYGSNMLPYGAIKLVNEGTVVKYVSRVVEDISYNIVAQPLKNVIYNINDTNITDKTIIDLQIDGTDEVQILVSIDSGETYKYFNGSEWVNYNDNLIGMSIETTNTLTRNIWKKLNYKDSIRLGFIVDSTDYDNVDKVKSVKLRTINK